VVPWSLHYMLSTRIKPLFALKISKHSALLRPMRHDHWSATASGLVHWRAKMPWTSIARRGRRLLYLLVNELIEQFFVLSLLARFWRLIQARHFIFEMGKCFHHAALVLGLWEFHLVGLESFVLHRLNFLFVKFKSFVLSSIGEEFSGVKFIGL